MDAYGQLSRTSLLNQKAKEAARNRGSYLCLLFLEKDLIRWKERGREDRRKEWGRWVGERKGKGRGRREGREDRINR